MNANVLWLTIGAVLTALAAAVAASQLHWGIANQPAMYRYADDAPLRCDGAAAPGTEGAPPPGLVVRAPSNYDPRRAHPLLVVFSPAGFNRALTERLTGLTHVATAAGLLVAYVDSLPLSRAAIDVFDQRVEWVTRHWCVDRQRITVSGHSDGGTVAQLLAGLERPARVAPATVVASGAGLIESDFAAFRCPDRIDVTLFHGRDDRHFPGYGASAAEGWARCLDCPEPPTTDAEGCRVYAGCRGRLRYCELPVGHWRWPAINDAIVAAASAQTIAR